MTARKIKNLLSKHTLKQIRTLDNRIKLAKNDNARLKVLLTTKVELLLLYIDYLREGKLDVH